MGSTLRERLLAAVRKSYARYVDSGPRSNAKIKALHGWVIAELREILNSEYHIEGLSDSGGKEIKVRGKYYGKKVDVAISRKGTTLGVVSVKFVMTNYRQNKHNYFEQQLGETANLRRSDIVFGHIMLLTQPTPYLKRGGEVKKFEEVDDRAIELYTELAQDHGQAHVPDVQCMAAFLLSDHNGKIVRQCQKTDLPNVSSSNFTLLDDKLGIDRFFEGLEAAIESKYLQTRV